MDRFLGWGYCSCLICMKPQNPFPGIDLQREWHWKEKIHCILLNNSIDHLVAVFFVFMKNRLKNTQYHLQPLVNIKIFIIPKFVLRITQTSKANVYLNPTNTYISGLACFYNNHDDISKLTTFFNLFVVFYSVCRVKENITKE